MHSRSLVAAAALCMVASVATTAPTGASVPVDTTALRDAVTIDGMWEHLEALQDIADAHGGTREASSPGYDASVAYVADRLTAAGYEVDIQVFDYPFFEDASVPVLERVAPAPVSYLDAGSNFPEGDFATMTFSASGSGEAVPVTAVDLSLDDPAASTSGCEDEDFVDFPEGDVALVQRGTCPFADKVVNADEAGASAVIVFNQGDDPDDPERTDVFFGTLGGVVADIPSFSASLAVGVELSAPGTTVTFAADTVNEVRSSANVLADTPTGRDDRVVVVGAHLDSVLEGPGINDNGSGVAAILEIAEQMAVLGIEPTNTVRFAFWGAEEAGLVGAEHHLSQLSPKQLRHIAVNLNFDMLGSPNYVRFVYDGDGSPTGTAGPNGSGDVERVFLEHFAAEDLETEPTDFDGRSDYGPFIDRGIPAGGLFSGAEEIKTPEEAELYGGTAGEAYDPCYHQACDTLANVNATALDELADAAAHAVLTFAMTTSSVQGTAQASPKPAAATGDHLGHRARR